MSEPCDSCGRDEPDLVEVHRVYFDLGAEDRERAFETDQTPTQVVDETERWCASCVATYPHVRD